MKKCNELLLFKNITKKEKLHKIFKILEMNLDESQIQI